MFFTEYPRWIPAYVHIATCLIDSNDSPEASTLEKLFQRYGGSYVKDPESLEFVQGSDSIYARIVSDGSQRAFMIASSRDPAIAGDSPKQLSPVPDFSNLFREIEGLLPEKPDSDYRIRVQGAEGEKGAINFL